MNVYRWDRRDFLRVSVLTGVATALGARSADASGPTDAAVLVQWAGDALQDSVELAACTEGTTSVGLALSTTPDLRDPVVVPGSAPDRYGWNRWQVAELAAGSRYYWQLLDATGGGAGYPLGAVSTFVTLQAAGVPCVIRRAVGSCTRNGSTVVPTAFEDLVEWGPDRVVHLGDLGYPIGLTRSVGTHVRALTKNLQAPGMADLLRAGCLDYIRSDHDTNSGNNLPNHHDAVTRASTSAWQQIVPFRLEDTRKPPHGVWRSEVEGRVRFVKLDYRSTDRTDSIGRSPTDRHSTMLGREQREWLQAEIAAAVRAHQLVVLLTDSGWNGTAPDPVDVPRSDKMPAYQYERDMLSDYAAGLGADMIIVHGDTHLLLQDQTHERNGFVVIGCSPFDQQAQGWFQDSYDVVYPPGQPQIGGTLEVQQYQRLTWADDGTAITFTAEARSCTGGTGETVATLTRTYQV